MSYSLAVRTGGTETEPIRVAIVNDYEVVVRGLHALVESHPAFEVVELDVDTDPVRWVDIALVDSFAGERRAGEQLRSTIGRSNVRRVVVYTWDLHQELIDEARSVGVSGYLSKTSSAEELIEALIRVHMGDLIFAEPTTDEVDITIGDWPGRAEGLSPREAEVLGLIVQGMSNTEIAERLFLSINSVKSYIRAAYRKAGVSRRSQAVVWGIEHGFEPRTRRMVPAD